MEDSMSTKLMTIAVIILEVIILECKCIYACFESLYYTLIPPLEKSVAGDIVLVTGTGHGIGRELAIKYASLGSTVICVDINAKGNEETVRTIKELGYKKVHSYSCDVSSKAEVDELVEKVTKEVGNITVLVNNAGIMPTHTLLDTTEEQITKMFGVNVFAHFWLLKAILPSMYKNNKGHIVALSSMAGILGLPNLVSYCGTKFAVRGIMEAIAEETRICNLATNVHFTCIYPYIVDTGLCKKPKMRFPSMLPMVTPKGAAEMIVSAMRRNALQMSLPPYMLKMNDIIRLFPVSVGRYLKDFLDTGVEAE